MTQSEDRDIHEALQAVSGEGTDTPSSQSVEPVAEVLVVKRGCPISCGLKSLGLAMGKLIKAVQHHPWWTVFGLTGAWACAQWMCVYSAWLMVGVMVFMALRRSPE